MKKLIAFVFLFFIALPFSFSQTYMGIKAGANVANMTINKEFVQGLNTNNENKIGYQIGVIAQEEITSKVYLRSEYITL